MRVNEREKVKRRLEDKIVCRLYANQLLCVVWKSVKCLFESERRC